MVLGLLSNAYRSRPSVSLYWVSELVVPVQQDLLYWSVSASDFLTMTLSMTPLIAEVFDPIRCSGSAKVAAVMPVFFSMPLSMYLPVASLTNSPSTYSFVVCWSTLMVTVTVLPTGSS